MTKIKLTEAQKLLLLDLSHEEKRMIGGYKPLTKLVSLGFASTRDVSFGSVVARITPAGRSHLSEVGVGVDKKGRLK